VCGASLLPRRRSRVPVAELEHGAAELHACGRLASTASIVPSWARWKAATRPAVAEDRRLPPSSTTRFSTPASSTTRSCSRSPTRSRSNRRFTWRGEVARTSPIDLSAERAWASGQAGSAYSAAVERACKELGAFAPRICHRASDLLLLLSLIRAGRAVALLPDILGADQDDRVAVRSIAEGTLTRTIYTAVRRGSARRPTVIALRRALVAVATRTARLPAHDLPLKLTIGSTPRAANSDATG
jgi:LysR substrate binding domain